MKTTKSVLEGIEGSSIDGLIVARRLAQFCPTSLSLDDFKKQDNINNNISLNNDFSIYKKDNKIEYIPPNPVVKLEKFEQKNHQVFNSSEFALGIESPKHRFAFLIPDIKPVDKENVNNCLKSNNYIKMKYELPNLLQINVCGSPPMKRLKPIKVVSFTNRKNENDMACVNLSNLVKEPRNMAVDADNGNW